MILPLRPIDAFVKRSMGALQKEYLVIGKTRVSAFTSWTVLAFFLGVTIAIGFLASRTGTFEQSEAARAPRTPKPVYSRWSKAQEGNCEGKTSATAQCRAVKLRKRIIEQGKRKTIAVQGFQTRSCTKNCEVLTLGAGAGACTTYDLGGETPSPPALIAFGNKLFIAVQGNAAAGYQTFINEWDPVVKRSLIPDIPGKSAGGWLWVGGGATSDTPQLKIEGTKLAMYVKGWDKGALDAAFRTEYTGAYPDYWIPWVYTGQGASTVIPGPFTTTFQGKTYNVKKDTDNSILLKEGAGCATTDALTVSKTFFGITPFTPTLLLDGKPPTTSTDTTATWNGILAGTRTITTTLASNTKAFYAVCTNATTIPCKKSFSEGSTIPFTHTTGQNDVISLVYADRAAYLSSGIMYSQGEVIHFTVPGINLDALPPECSVSLTTDVPTTDFKYQLLQQAADAWSKSNINVSITYDSQAASREVPMSKEDIKDNKGADGFDVVKFLSLTTGDFAQDTGVTAIYSAVVGAGGNNFFFNQADIINNLTKVSEAAAQKGWQLEDEILSTLSHEIGHYLGLADSSDSYSIMIGGALSGKVVLPSGNDIQMVNSFYSQCTPKKAALHIRFHPNPAEFGTKDSPAFGQSCVGSLDTSWWQIFTEISELSGAFWVTLNTYTVEYYTSGSSTSLACTDCLSRDFSELTQTKKGVKGFPGKHINAGQDISANLCQVPWKPEKLLKIRFHVNGVDESSQSVSANNTVYLK